MPWDDAILVSAGKLRKPWDSLSELSSSLCERRLERQLWDLRYCLSNLPSLRSFSVTYDVTQIARLNWECIGRFSHYRLQLRCSLSIVTRESEVWWLHGKWKYYFARLEVLCSPSKRLDWFCGHPASVECLRVYLKVGGGVRGVNRPRLEPDHSFPFSFEIKYE